MRLRTVLLGLLALVVILIGGAFAVLVMTDYSKYRGAIEAKVSEATGRKFKIGSDFRVIVGLSPTLVANDVEFANASWGSRPNMVVVKQFEVQINLLPLLFGHISVARLQLIDADILLETDARGHGNWEFHTVGAPAAPARQPTPQPPSPPKEAARGIDIPLPAIHNLNIEGVLLRFHDGQTNETRRFSLGHLNLGSVDPSAPLQIDINGTYNDFYFEIGGDVGSTNAASRRGDPFPVDITAKLGATDATVRIQGDFKQPLEARDYDLRVTASTGEVAQIADFVRDAHFGALKLPKLGPLKADFQVKDAGPADAGSGGVPSLASIKIDAGRDDLLRLQIDGTVRDVIKLTGVAVDATASGTEIAALSGLVLPGFPNGLPQIPPLGPYKLAVKMARGADRISLPNVRFDLGRDEQMKVTVTGAVQDPLAGKGYALTVDGRTQDLAAAANQFNVSLPLAGPLTLTGKIADSGPKRYALSGFEVKAAGSDVTGSGSLSLEGARPAATVELASTMIDLGKIMPRKAPGAAAPPSAPPAKPSDGRVFPADPLPIEALKAFEGDVRYRATTIRLPTGPQFHDTTLQASLHDGTLSLQPVTTTIGNGQVSGTVSLADKGGALALKVSVRGMSLDEIDHEVPGEDLIDGGITNADLDINGVGNSVRAIMGGLNGSVFLAVGPSTFKSRYTDMLGLGGLTNLVAQSLPRLERTTLHCFVTRFDIENGLAKSRVLVADTGRLTLDGSGTINLREEILNLGLDTHTKVTNLLSLMPPISVSGTLANPDFEPDVGAAAVGAIGNVVDDILRQPGNLIDAIFGSSGSPDQEICAAAYKKAGLTATGLPGALPAGGKPAAPAAPPSAPQGSQPGPSGQRTTPSPNDPIQNLGQGIQRQFNSVFGK